MDRLRGIIKLKTGLLIQSLSPLFLLILIKYFDCRLIYVVHNKILTSCGCAVISPIHSPINRTEIILVLASALMVLFGVWVYIGYNAEASYGFIDKGEKIALKENISDVSASFFATYLIPLLMDDLNTPKGLSLFGTILVMMYLIMRNTNLCYQNPILPMVGYRIYRFTFVDTIDSTLLNKEFICITKGTINVDHVIIRKEITDGVYMVYNKNGGEKDGK